MCAGWVGNNRLKPYGNRPHAAQRRKQGSSGTFLFAALSSSFALGTSLKPILAIFPRRTAVEIVLPGFSVEGSTSRWYTYTFEGGNRTKRREHIIFITIYFYSDLAVGDIELTPSGARATDSSLSSVGPPEKEGDHVSSY